MEQALAATTPVPGPGLDPKITQAYPLSPSTGVCLQEVCG